MTEKDYISYSDIEKQCRVLATHIKKSGCNKIVAITRGGMVPACLLAQFLNIRQVSSIALVSYEGDKQSESLSCLTRPEFYIDDKTVFVDDLYDSGNTYRFIKQEYPQAKCAVVYTKEKDAALDFPAAYKEKGTWIVFPWEQEPID